MTGIRAVEALPLECFEDAPGVAREDLALTAACGSERVMSRQRVGLPSKGGTGQLTGFGT